MRYMLPFLNVEDLQDEKSLLMLIFSRSQHPPHTFARHERDFSPHGIVETDRSRAPLHKMQLDKLSDYGKCYNFDSAEEADNFEYGGEGLEPVAGLQVVYMQDKILAFLIGAVKLLLPQSLRDVDTEQVPTDPEIPAGLYDEDGLDMFDMARTEPYRPRRGLQLERLTHLVSTRAQVARDLVWDIREDPRRFEDFFNATLDHKTGRVLEICGYSSPEKNRTRVSNGTPETPQ
jgi:hypothetical protein